VGSHRADKDKVSLPNQEPYRINCPMLHENSDIVQELGQTIANAGFVPGHRIGGEEL